MQYLSTDKVLDFCVVADIMSALIIKLVALILFTYIKDNDLEKNKESFCKISQDRFVCTVCLSQIYYTKN